MKGIGIFSHSTKEISSFEIVTLHTSGMRYITDHEIVAKGDDKAEVTRYSIRFSDGKDIRIPEKQAVTGMDDVLKILNDCRMLSWDGFFGKHPKNVRDGEMFRLDASVNGGRTIHASGSENFPKDYRKFKDWLYEILSGSDKN